MDSLNKGLRKVEAALKWDPTPIGSPPMDLDLVAAVYAADDQNQHPVYVVHFDQRAPDGTITLNRDSRTGQGFGWDEVLTLELDRLSSAYGRVVVGVAVQQREGPRTFRDVNQPEARLREGYEELGTTDFAAVPDAAAATVAEFLRAADGEWTYRPLVQGFDTDLTAFTAAMGNKPA